MCKSKNGWWWGGGREKIKQEGSLVHVVCLFPWVVQSSSWWKITFKHSHTSSSSSSSIIFQSFLSLYIKSLQQVAAPTNFAWCVERKDESNSQNHIKNTIIVTRQLWNVTLDCCSKSYPDGTIAFPVYWSISGGSEHGEDNFFWKLQLLEPDTPIGVT